MLGQDQDVLDGGFDEPQAYEGTIYGVRLYDNIRTPGEIIDTVHAPVADASDPNLVANWVADPDGGTITDLTGSHPMTTSGDVGVTWVEGADTLVGGTGNDTIYGDGDDSVDGGDGADQISGGDGNDTITIGDPGAALPSAPVLIDGDNQTGSAGSDTYVWDTDGGSTMNVILGEGTGTGGPNDGDGAADSIYVADTDDGGRLQLLQFDVGVDQVFLPEAPSSITYISGSSNRSDFDVTYGNGNTQSFRFFYDGATTIDPNDFFAVA